MFPFFLVLDKAWSSNGSQRWFVIIEHYGSHLTTITLAISHLQNSELTPSQLFYSKKVKFISAPL